MATLEERVAQLESNYGTMNAQVTSFNGRLTTLEEDKAEFDANLHNSSQQGSDIDSAIASVRQNGSKWSGKAEKGTVIPLTLTVGGWNTTSKTQTLTNAALLASEDYRYLVGSVMANEDAYIDAGIKAYDITTEGQITFHYEALPEADLLVEVIRQEVKP